MATRGWRRRPRLWGDRQMDTHVNEQVEKLYLWRGAHVINAGNLSIFITLLLVTLGPRVRARDDKLLSTWWETLRYFPSQNCTNLSLIPVVPFTCLLQSKSYAKKRKNLECNLCEIWNLGYLSTESPVKERSKKEEEDTILVLILFLVLQALRSSVIPRKLSLWSVNSFLYIIL